MKQMMRTSITAAEWDESSDMIKITPGFNFDNLHVMTNFELGWVASALDGEGTITASRGGEGYFLQGITTAIGNTNLKFTERVMKFIGFGSIDTVKYAKGKCIYRWYTSDKGHILYLLKQLLPYLINKRKIAEAVIEYIEVRQYRYRMVANQREEELFEKVLAARVRGNAAV